MRSLAANIGEHTAAALGRIRDLFRPPGRIAPASERAGRAFGDSDRSLEQVDRVNASTDRQREQVDQRAEYRETLNELEKTQDRMENLLRDQDQQSSRGDRIRAIMQKQRGERER